jgi:PleD family two-component response regulator
MSQQKRILIIDDDIHHLADAKRCLQTQGYAVSIHERPADSPVVMRYLDPDIVLLNVGMHDMSEDKLSYLLSSNRHAKEIPVIFYSSSDEESLRQAVMRHGAKGYICKGDISRLYDKVRCFLPR